jgi:acyl-CoA thioester hydrolase
MVSRITLEYKRPLRGGDSFVVCINMLRKGAKVIFQQDIYNLGDGSLALKGEVDVVCLKNGRLTRGEVFDEMFKEFFTKNSI